MIVLGATCSAMRVHVGYVGYMLQQCVVCTRRWLCWDWAGCGCGLGSDQVRCHEVTLNFCTVRNIDHLCAGPIWSDDKLYQGEIEIELRSRVRRPRLYDKIGIGSLLLYCLTYLLRWEMSIVMHSYPVRIFFASINRTSTGLDLVRSGTSVSGNFYFEISGGITECQKYIFPQKFTNLGFHHPKGRITRDIMIGGQKRRKRRLKTILLCCRL